MVVEEVLGAFSGNQESSSGLLGGYGEILVANEEVFWITVVNRKVLKVL